MLNRLGSRVHTTFISACVLMLLTTVQTARADASKKLEPASTSSDRIEYYVGDFQDASVDGKQLYGPRRIALLKRVVSKSSGTITEHLVIALSQLTRTIKVSPDASAEYDAMPPRERGQVFYEGSPWTASAWRYAVDLLRAGSKKVEVKRMGDSLTFEEKIFGPKGKSTGIRSIKLRQAKAAEYLAKYRSWERKHGAPQIVR